MFHQKPKVPNWVNHIRELRQRLGTYLAFYALLSIALYFISDELLIFLARPLQEAYGQMTTSLPLEMIYTTMPEGFFVHLKLALYGAFIASIPFLEWHLWKFMAPGLYARERKAILGFLCLAPFLFLTGGALVYLIIMPKAWQFFLSFDVPQAEGIAIRLLPQVGEYVSLSMQFILAFGLTFQLPLVLILLAKFQIISSTILLKSRKYVIVGLLIIAAILTPPDVISQIGLAIPLLILYELSILVIKRIERRREQK